MFGPIGSLPAQARRNLYFETLYSASAGAISGLAMLGQVAVIGSLGGGLAEATIATAAMPACSVLQPIWATLARHWPLKRMVLVSGVLRSLPLFCIGWVTNSWVFSGLILSYYFLAGPLQLGVPSLYKYNYPDAHRAWIIGFFRAVQHGVSIPIMLGCALLFDRQPDLYLYTYPLGGLAGLLGLMFYCQIKANGDDPVARRAHSERPSFGGIIDVLRDDRRFLLFQATIFLTGTGYLMTRSIWLFLLHETFHVSQFTLSLLVQVLPLVLGASTAIAWGKLMDRTSPVAGRIAFAGLGLFAYLCVFISFYVEILLFSIIGAVLRGLVLGAAEVATPAGNLYFSARAERAALYESISAFLRGIRGLTMPTLGWLLFFQISSFLFLVPAFLSFVSLFVALRLWKMDYATRMLFRERARQELEAELDLDDEKTTAQVG